MWEYTSVDDINLANLIDKANELGEQGWEAVNFTTTKEGFGWGRHIMVLKRRIEPAGDFKS